MQDKILFKIVAIGLLLGGIGITAEIIADSKTLKKPLSQKQKRDLYNKTNTPKNKHLFTPKIESFTNANTASINKLPITHKKMRENINLFSRDYRHLENIRKDINSDKPIGEFIKQTENPNYNPSTTLMHEFNKKANYSAYKKMELIKQKQLELGMNAKRDALKANPVATGNEISRDCVNDDSSSDSYGDTCSSWYDSSESEGSYGCSGGYDDDDFSAAEQCCVCGGGSDDGGSDDGGDVDCADGEFDCGDGSCIPGSWECDVYWCDCGDCSDEADCGSSDPTCADTDCGYWLNLG